MYRVHKGNMLKKPREVFKCK